MEDARNDTHNMERCEFCKKDIYRSLFAKYLKS